MIFYRKTVKRWTKPGTVIIVLYFISTAQLNAGERLRADAGSAEQKQAPEKQDRSTESELVIDENQWDETAAELYLQTRRLRKELKETKAAVSAVLSEESAEKDVQNLEALAHIRRFAQRRQQLIRKLKNFRSYLKTMLDIVEPSKGLRKALTGQYSEVLREARDLLSEPSAVAERGGSPLGKKGCRVIEKSRKLKVVVLAAGFAEGVRPGMRWHAASKKSEQALTLESIGVRRHISAATVIKGSVSRIDPGDKVVRGSDEAR